MLHYLKILSIIIIFFFKVKHTWDRSQESKLLEARIQVKLVAENEKKEGKFEIWNKRFLLIIKFESSYFLLNEPLKVDKGVILTLILAFEDLICVLLA